MKKQKVIEKSTVDSSAPDALMKPGENAVLAFPGSPVLRNAGPLRARLIDAVGTKNPPSAESILSAEDVSLFVLDLPIKGAAKRLAALPFALEDRLAAPVEQIHAALHPAPGRFGTLAAVVARSRMTEVRDCGVQGPVLFETLAIPAPDPDDGGKAAWAIWRDGARAVVRVSDGTGFALRADQLLALWIAAARPTLTSLGAALPAGMTARDLSANPPPPDPADLRFDLRQGAFAPEDANWVRPLTRLAGLVALALLAHLALGLADLKALNRIAAREQGFAQIAIAARLPGVDVTGDPQAIALRLAPRATLIQGSSFLPLFARASAGLITGAPDVAVDRLVWDGANDAITLRVTANSLEDLQQIERSLLAADLQVTTGVATAGNGGAQAEMKIFGGAQ